MADGVAITAGSGTTISTDDAGAGGHVQIVKQAISADGSATPIPADATNGLDVDVTRVQGTVTVDSELPAAAALSDTIGNPTTPMVGAGGMVYDGTQWVRARAASTSDGVAGTGLAATVPYLLNGSSTFNRTFDVTARVDGNAGGGVQAVAGYMWNGASYDRPRGDVTNGLDVDVTRMPTTTTRPAGTTGGQTIVASTVTPNTTLIAADANRFGLLIFNDSTASLFVLLGAGTESATVWTVKIPPDGYYEVPDGFAAMRASGHWSLANGNARITAAT